MDYSDAVERGCAFPRPNNELFTVRSMKAQSIWNHLSEERLSLSKEEAVNTRTVSHKLTLRVKESLSRRSTRTSRTKCLSEAGSSLTSVTRQELRILFCFIYMSLFSCISCFYSYKYDLCLHFLSLLHVCTCTLSNLVTWSPEPGRSPVGVTGTGDWWYGPTAGPTTRAKW